MKAGDKLRRTLIMAGVICFIFVCLAACSAVSPETIDPAAIDATLTTEPANSVAGSPVKLKAEFAGAELSRSSGVTFEIRVDEEPVLLDAEKEGQNTFYGTYTFPKPGTYEVYLHLYTDDIHMTKMKKVEVQ